MKMAKKLLPTEEGWENICETQETFSQFINLWCLFTNGKSSRHFKIYQVCSPTTKQTCLEFSSISFAFRQYKNV